MAVQVGLCKLGCARCERPCRVMVVTGFGDQLRCSAGQQQALGCIVHRVSCCLLLTRRLLLMAAESHHQHPPGLAQPCAAATAQVSAGCGSHLLMLTAVTSLQALRPAQH